MTKSEALRELESMGTEQNRKLYQRHGVKGPAFGVSYANLGALQRRIRIDHPLALALWATGNHDARVLANMIAEPNSMSARELDRWIVEVDNHMLSESIASMLLRSNDAHSHAQRWIESPLEWTCATGWQVFGGLASGDHEFSSEYLLKRLTQIQNTIQRAPNRVRHSMVLALIGIGTRGDKLEEAAVTAACMIGPVHVDHGETNCVTPDPIPYLRRIAAHRSARSLAAASAAPPKKKAKAARPSTPKPVSSGASKSAKPKSADTNKSAKPKGAGSTKSATAKSAGPAKSAAPANSVKAASAGSDKAAKPKSTTSSKGAKAKVDDARPTRKATKHSSSAPSKSVKKPSSGGARSSARSVAGGARARKKTPARAAGTKGASGSAGSSKRRPGSRASR